MRDVSGVVPHCMPESELSAKLNKLTNLAVPVVWQALSLVATNLVVLPNKEGGGRDHSFCCLLPEWNGKI